MKIDTSTYEWTIFFDHLEKMKVGDHADSPHRWFRAILYRDGIYILWISPTIHTGLGRIVRDADELRTCIRSEIWSGIIITY